VNSSGGSRLPLKTWIWQTVITTEFVCRFDAYSIPRSSDVGHEFLLIWTTSKILRRPPRLKTHLKFSRRSVASVRLVSPGVVTYGVTFLLPQKVMTFLVIVLQTTVTTFTLSTFQVIVCPPQKIKLSLGCHPLDGVTRGGPPQPSPLLWRHWRRSDQIFQKYKQNCVLPLNIEEYCDPYPDADDFWNLVRASLPRDTSPRRSNQ